MLLLSGQTLFPVLGETADIALPRFLKRSLISQPVRACQGLQYDVELLEEQLSFLGCVPAFAIDYYLMSYDNAPFDDEALAGASMSKKDKPVIPIKIRPPRLEDYPALLEMQMSYEMEEVMLPGRKYNPQAAKVNLKNILRNETSLVAEFDGKLIGKINTNARGWTRRQIGGVYVKPPFRRLGVAGVMLDGMKKRLIAEGKVPSLYVRKKNIAAVGVYRKAGFKTLAGYRISYMA
jgi:ribosomal protein S18 acetylase RimI-like enzyme